MTAMDPSGAPLPDFDPARVRELDLRETLRADERAFTDILDAADALPDASVLHLRSRFRPDALFGLMRQHGLIHHTVNFGEDDWSSWFWRPTAPPPAPAPRAPTTALDEGVLDLRHLVPPEPMAMILERLDRTQAPFEAMLPFFPTPFLPFLEAGGWTAVQLEERSDGVVVRIQRSGGER